MATTRAGAALGSRPARPGPASKEAWLASLNLGLDGGGPRDRPVGHNAQGPAEPAGRRVGEDRRLGDPRDVGVARGALPAPQRLGLSEVPGVRAGPELLPRGRAALE